MSLFVQTPWISVALPFVLAVLVVIVGRWSKATAAIVSMLAPAAVLLTGAGSLAAIPAAGSPGLEPWTSALASRGDLMWFHLGDVGFSVGWGVDTLAAIMLLVVGVVALMVMVFSLGYMADDPGWNRYYALLCLFTGSMTLLVIADSLTTLFIGWELVGTCSYLLIGFWYRKPSAAAAAVKAFLTTRVGDIGLLIGLAVLWTGTRSLGYVRVMHALGDLPAQTVTIAAICIAIGAIGKSAQFPLHIWLPDAMEGPTPVSALIHAATMVAAGVFLVARVWPLFAAAPAAQTLLLTVGVISALGASLAAVAQRDIKKVLAYSTISQLGFMFCALGVGAWTVAFFHLVTHAAFKALLFLTSGSVIHGAGTQDMREMGGLRKEMPVTFVVWLIGIGALVGIPPLSGFFSKDLIFDVVWLSQPIAAVFLFVAAVSTGFYSGRATRLTFFGARQGSGHAHESPLSMLVPVGILAVLAAILGFARVWLFTRLGEHPESLSLPISTIAVTLGVAGAALGWAVEGQPRSDESLETRLGIAWRAMASAFGWDTLVARVIVVPAVAASRVLWAVIDRYVIDGIVEGSAAVTNWTSRRISEYQTGDAQWYGVVIVMGVVLLLAISVMAGR